MRIIYEISKEEIEAVKKVWEEAIGSVGYMNLVTTWKECISGLNKAEGTHKEIDDKTERSLDLARREINWLVEPRNTFNRRDDLKKPTVEMVVI